MTWYEVLFAVIAASACMYFAYRTGLALDAVVDSFREWRRTREVEEAVRQAKRNERHVRVHMAEVPPPMDIEWTADMDINAPRACIFDGYNNLVCIHAHPVREALARLEAEGHPDAREWLDKCHKYGWV